ncbi:MAG: PKD domain-containing protein [Cyclobacteriaceae bacterium]|nr:PKD domain-containing protein [Cyclobacteriaceae bacterium]
MPRNLKGSSLCVCFFFLVTLNLWGQTEDNVTYTPPSPDASALMEYSSTPVDYHRGIPKVSIPLMELKGKRLSVSVSLNYHASGIKVQDISSSVGLGWVLNAGGVVTRLVRGLPDEDVNGYMNRDFYSTMNNNWLGVANGTVDTEPDIFYFNFMGYTGKLILDDQGMPMQLPEQDFLISAPDFTSLNPKWEFTDMYGVKYIFGKTSNSRETTTTKLSHQNNSKTFISSWYLSEVIHPLGQERITFQYLESINNINYNYFRQIRNDLIVFRQNGVGCVPSYPPSSTFDQVTQVMIHKPKYLQVIQSFVGADPLGKIELFYESDRQDISNAARLLTVRLLNLSNKEVRKLRLVNNQYFVSEGCTSSLCKRLKLSAIVDDTNNASLVVNKFRYNEDENLPARNSVKYDHWGFYNNNTVSHAIPPGISSYNITYPGADKSPDTNKAQANILVEIINVNNGFTKFYFELNKYYDGVQNTSTGGLRIWKLIEGDGIGSEIVKEFTYVNTLNQNISSGKIYRDNRYQFEYSNFYYCGSPVPIDVGYTSLYRYSMSLIEQFDVGGTHVGYSFVQALSNNNGTELFTYTNFDTNPDDEPNMFYPSGYTHPDFTSPDGPPFVSRGDRSYERGLLKEYKVIGTDGRIKYKQVSDFDFFLVSSKEILGGRLAILSVFNNNYGLKSGVYKYYHRGIRLMSTTEYQYDQTDDTKFISKSSLYNYDAKYKNLINGVTVIGDGIPSTKTDIKFPYNYFVGEPFSSSDLSGLYLLCTKNMVGTPIEITNSIKYPGESSFRTISAYLTAYKDNPSTGSPVPSEKFKFTIFNPSSTFIPSFISGSTFIKSSLYKRIRSFNQYDQFDNLLQEEDETGNIMEYQWGYNKSLVESVSINSSHQKLFEHEPFVGLRSITDANSQKINFEYDVLSRLKLIKDGDDQILTRYRYHHKGQSEILSSSIVVGTCREVGRPLSFSSGEGAEYGQTTYYWDFGNGNTATTTSGSASHTYSEPGTYQVKVRKENPEHLSVTATTSVTILPALAHVSICADGPVFLDNCNTANVDIGSCSGNNLYFYSPTILTANHAGIASSYLWEYRYNGGNWTVFGHTSQVYAPSGFYYGGAVGQYEVRCTIESQCGVQFVSSSEYLILVQSSTGPCEQY